MTTERLHDSQLLDLLDDERRMYQRQQLVIARIMDDHTAKARECITLREKVVALESELNILKGGLI